MQSQTTLGLCESTMAWKGSYETELIFFTLSLEKNLLFFKFIVNRFFFLSVIAKGAFRLRQSTIWLTGQSCIQIYFFPCTYYPHVELKWQITFTVS